MDAFLFSSGIETAGALNQAEGWLVPSTTTASAVPPPLHRKREGTKGSPPRQGLSAKGLPITPSVASDQEAFTTGNGGSLSKRKAPFRRPSQEIQ